METFEEIKQKIYNKYNHAIITEHVNPLYGTQDISISNNGVTIYWNKDEYLGYVIGLGEGDKMYGDYPDGSADNILTTLSDKTDPGAHNTDGDDCWCEPEVEKHEGGNLIIHRRTDN